MLQVCLGELHLQRGQYLYDASQERQGVRLFVLQRLKERLGKLLGQQVNEYFRELDEFSVYELGLLPYFLSEQDHVGRCVEYAKEYLLCSVVVF